MVEPSIEGLRIASLKSSIFQMGPSEPPGTTFIPGLRENLYGLFTINLGVYVPEVARYHGGGECKSWVQEPCCCVRTRLGMVTKEGHSEWWPAQVDDAAMTEVCHDVTSAGIAFLDRFATRDKILSEWLGRSEKVESLTPPRIVMAIILAERGKKDDARELLALQANETLVPAHATYVHSLAERLGLGVVAVDTRMPSRR